MNATAKIARAILFLFAFIIASCQQEDDALPAQSKNESKDAPTSSTALGPWQRVFTENFSSTASFNNWQRANRFDYNSNLCQYDPNVPTIGTYDNRNVLVLTATKSGNIWKSGHVKSYFNFKPGVNEEYRVSAAIKLVAMNGTSWYGFNSTYGVWPAFWTVNETAWPTKGEIDIMEGYSYGGSSRFASNLFYGTTAGQNQLGSSAERTYGVSEGWHMYDEYWKNVNGWVTVTISLDGNVVATYTNSVNPNLRLQNFGPHNIILNLNVGSNYNIFDNSRINVFTKTMMWVDYVTVDKRTL
jgi:hypothetical protein